jgi:hypothetical protein
MPGATQGASAFRASFLPAGGETGAGPAIRAIYAFRAVGAQRPEDHGEGRMTDDERMTNS